MIEPTRDQLPGSNTSAYAVQHWVTVGDGTDEAIWTAREAPVVMLGKLWPSPVSQAHHGVTPPGFDQSFLDDPADFTNGHIYSLLMSGNFRTNFALVQPSDVLFRYSLTSRSRGEVAVAARLGEAASQPLETAWVQGPQTGPLPPADVFVGLDVPNIALLALKAAEDGDGIVLRLAETAGRSHHSAGHACRGTPSRPSGPRPCWKNRWPNCHIRNTIYVSRYLPGALPLSASAYAAAALPTPQGFWQLRLSHRSRPRPVRH